MFDEHTTLQLKQIMKDAVNEALSEYESTGASLRISRVVTRQQATRMMGIGWSLLRRLIREGVINLNSDNMVPVSEITSYLEAKPAFNEE